MMQTQGRNGTDCLCHVITADEHGFLSRRRRVPGTARVHLASQHSRYEPTGPEEDDVYHCPECIHQATVLHNREPVPCGGGHLLYRAGNALACFSRWEPMPPDTGAVDAETAAHQATPGSRLKTGWLQRLYARLIQEKKET